MAGHQDSPKVPEKGIWPDGSSGVKNASFCITCGLLEVRPERTCFNEGKEAEFTDVEVIPLSALLSDEVVEAAASAIVNGHLERRGDFSIALSALSAVIEQVGGAE